MKYPDENMSARHTVRLAGPSQCVHAPAVLSGRAAGKRITVVPVDPEMKKVWIHVQQQNRDPVNAIGRKIDPKDQKMMTFWRAEGMEQYLKKV